MIDERGVALLADKEQPRTSLNASSTSIGQFLARMFRQMNDAKVTYCVLRGYEGLPEFVSHDMDILVHQNHLGLFEKILQELCQSGEWRLIRVINRYGYFAWYLARNNAEGIDVLHVDTWTKITWKGIHYVDEDVILGTRIYYNGFWVAAAGGEAAVSLLKEYLQFGRIKDKGEGKTKKRIARLVAEDAKNFIAVLTPCFGGTTSSFLLDGAKSADWDRLEGEVGYVQRLLLTRALKRNLVSQFLNWAHFLWGHVSDKVLHPSGLFVCLIGPDGSGKTTISRGLQHDMEDIFGAVRYYHGHWGLLPELKVYRNVVSRLLKKGNQKFACSEDANHDQNFAEFGLVRALLYVFYYSLEYVLGYFLIMRAKGRGELVLFDRYLYDYIIQSKYSRVPRWLLRLIESFIPRPDILIWLSNQPGVIHARKPELSVAEISEQLVVCQQIVDRYPKTAHVVHTSADPESTLRAVRQKIIEFMVERQS